MKTQVMIASVLVATFAAPFAAQAQGVPGGIAHGMYEGNRRAGPVGAVVGGAVGGVIGGIEGVLGLNTYQASYSEPVTPERPYHPHKHHLKGVPCRARRILSTMAIREHPRAPRKRPVGALIR